MSVRSSGSSIKRDVADFKNFVEELSKKINNAGCLWNDSKYFELRDRVSHMAAESREIIREGERCQNAIESFMRICSEEWYG